MPTANLDIANAIASEMAQVWITGTGNTPVVKAYVTENITIGSTVSWGNPMEQMINSIKSSMGIAGSALGAGMNAMTSLKVMTLQETVKQWAGSEGGSLKLPLFFIALTNQDDVRSQVNTLMDYVFPQQANDFIMKPPANYSTHKNMLTADGVLSVRIGNWFKAVKLMVINGGVSVTYSKEITPSGKPLYCQASVTFTPFRALTYDDWKGMFI
jgi:hypothetical protein